MTTAEGAFRRWSQFRSILLWKSLVFLLYTPDYNFEVPSLVSFVRMRTRPQTQSLLDGQAPCLVCTGIVRTCQIACHWLVAGVRLVLIMDAECGRRSASFLCMQTLVVVSVLASLPWNVDVDWWELAWQDTVRWCGDDLNFWLGIEPFCQ
jgi:hypothetical protein